MMMMIWIGDERSNNYFPDRERGRIAEEGVRMNIVVFWTSSEV